MKYGLYQKAMVFATLVLFVGASVIPSISGNISELSNGLQEGMTILATTGKGSTYTVHPTDPNANFTTIQATINAASNGDSIEVWNSTYIENVNVNKQLNIYARDGPLVTTVAGAITTDYVFEVTVDNVNISGFAVTGATGSSKAGIYLNGVSYCNISNNDISSNYYGIYLNPSDYNEIIGNSISFNTNHGIHLSNSDYNEIAGNEVSDNNYGLCLQSSGNNNVDDNIISFNTYDGIWLYSHYSDYNEITNNTVEWNSRYGINLGSGCEDNNLIQNTINYNGNYGLYIYSCRNYISQDNVVNGENIYHFYKIYGTPSDPIVVENLTLTGLKVINLAKITLCESRYIIVRNNTVANSDKGIYVSSSDHNEIIDNTATNNEYGIYLNPSDHNEIIGNSISFNIYDGIYLSNSDYNEISTNTVEWNNRYGIQLGSGCEENNITQNIINNNVDYGLYVTSAKNYISQQVVNGENIYHFYKVYGTPSDPIVVENLTLTGLKVIYPAKITLCESGYIIVRNNTVANSDKGIYVSSSNYNEIIDNTATDNSYGIYLNPSDHNEIIGNSISFNTNHGIYLSNSDYNEIAGNEVSDNNYGLCLHSSGNNNVDDNIISFNTYDGIWLYSHYSDYNEITNNTVEWNSRYGINLGSWCEDNNLIQNTINYNGNYGLLISTSNNLIYNNYFNNTNNAGDNGINVWNTTKKAGTNIIGGSYLGGNYWSDYNGIDIDGDGLGDTMLPYNCFGNIQNGGDWLPLVMANDTVPPEIIDNTPSEASAGHLFTFNATVTDNVDVSTVWVEYWYGTGIHMNVSMNNVAGDYWEKIIVIDDTIDMLHYIISANDSSNNWNNTGIKDVTIYDNDDPEITNVQAIPSIQNIGGYVNISATVIDNIDVDEVYLHIEYPDSIIENLNLRQSYKSIAKKRGTIENFSITQNKTGDTYYCNKTYQEPGIYTYHIWVNDTSGNHNVSANYTFEIINQPPNTPSQLSGPTSGYICISYDYSTSTTDPDGDNVKYGLDWDGDLVVDEWSGWYSSGDTCTMSHSWDDPGTYDVRVKAKDIYDAESGWSNPLSVTMENHPPNTPSNPSPTNGATDVNVEAGLSWTGGDPDSCDTVTYDVYFGTTSPPPKVASNQSATTYNPGIMDYNTQYYWMIVAWDNHGALAAGLIWEFTTEGETEPDLDCDGTLIWTGVSPGSTVTGSFIVENIGEPTSLLDWEITQWPDWGSGSSWAFNPLSGDDLTPEAGAVTVNVLIVAPDVENSDFSGQVKIENKENSSDFCTIPVSLSTPVSQPSSRVYNIWLL